MSGGMYSSYSLQCEDVEWNDKELNELWQDLTANGEFSVRGYGGLLQSLDFYECGDTDEDDYREAVQKFKAKWFGRTQKNRVEFYKRKIQEYADKCKEEFAIQPKED